ncbi:hypothetical protein GCM10008170_37010 [Methylopila capsulata]|uniref:Uncharacterized protein n=1 Tax=Methylopila capsulata TaxID=61654 RepID=A0A9W6IYX7_9HYPH|nr:hypothetical protein GCM10008170_37010 [Methylopila capsulata]
MPITSISGSAIASCADAGAQAAVKAASEAPTSAVLLIVNFMEVSRPQRLWPNMAKLRHFKAGDSG